MGCKQEKSSGFKVRGSEVNRLDSFIFPYPQIPVGMDSGSLPRSSYSFPSPLSSARLSDQINLLK